VELLGAFAAPNDDAVTYLAGTLNDAKPTVRVAAVDEIGLLGQRGASTIAALMKALATQQPSA